LPRIGVNENLDNSAGFPDNLTDEFDGNSTENILSFDTDLSSILNDPETGLGEKSDQNGLVNSSFFLHSGLYGMKMCVT